MLKDPLDGLDRPILVFSGNFGSGKSEVSVNTAFRLSRKGRKTAIVDLDVVNPYFRCREAREALEDEGIEVIAPGGELRDADLPIILPEIRGRIGNFDGVLILDVGGDDIGARALASLKDLLSKKSHHFIMVINERRPFTRDLEGALATIERIEGAAKTKATALVGNTHLMEHTDEAVVKEGYRLLRKVSEQRDLPILFITLPKDLGKRISFDEIHCPVLPLERRLRPPWMEADEPLTNPQPGRPWGMAPKISFPGSGDD